MRKSPWPDRVTAAVRRQTSEENVEHGPQAFPPKFSVSSGPGLPYQGSEGFWPLRRKESVAERSHKISGSFSFLRHFDRFDVNV